MAASFVVVRYSNWSNWSCYERIARHPGRIPAFESVATELAIKAFNLAPQGDEFCSIVDRTALAFANRHAWIMRQRSEVASYFFGFGFGWLPAEIAMRTTCASLASLSSRRRAMLARTSAAFFATS